MNGEETSKKLIEIQEKLDPINEDQIKEEFVLKLRYFDRIRSLLAERDTVALEIDQFWETALLNCEFAEVLFSLTDEKDNSEYLHSAWIKSLFVEYRPDYQCYVRVEAHPNEYFENKVLEKEFSVLDISENKGTKHTDIQWTGKKVLDNQFLRFFSSANSVDDDSINMFYIFYDVYVNAVYYYLRVDEHEHDHLEETPEQPQE